MSNSIEVNKGGKKKKRKREQCRNMNAERVFGTNLMFQYKSPGL